MRIKAIKSFCGILTMAAGEVREYGNEYVLADLLRAGYVEAAEQETEAAEQETEAAEQETEAAEQETEGKPAAKRQRKNHEGQ